MPQHKDDTFIELKGIKKQYGGVTALDDVDFRVKTGEAIRFLLVWSSLHRVSFLLMANYIHS